MNAENATTTAAECLKMALYGGVDEWTALHEMCQDYAVARIVFDTFSTVGPEHRKTVDSWQQLLKEIHPNLERRE